MRTAVEVIAHRVPDRPEEIAVPCAEHGVWERRRITTVPTGTPHFDRCLRVEVTIVIDPEPFDPRWAFRLYGRPNIAASYARR
ncbi:hypothetical protein [Dactylosporangium sp. NPDC006015]|uniref:hypothetical protein n=1 Tax=Dactylosporangium sp. NPDC006015 TaxID=3154576 RepID=UPI0033B008C8